MTKTKTESLIKDHNWESMKDWEVSGGLRQACVREMASKSYFLFKPHLQYVPPPLSLSAVFGKCLCSLLCYLCLS